VIFAYKGYTKKGERVRSKIEAMDIEEAKSRLKAEGILYESLHVASQSVWNRIRFTKSQVLSFYDLAILSRDLSVYIQSGISIVNAIKLATNQYKTHKMHTLFLNSLGTFLNEGKNFFQALELQTVYVLPSFFKQSIKVSENSGILGDVLLELSVYLKEQDKIAKQIKNALAYPMFIFILSIAIVIFMMSFIVPKITSIFSQLKQEIPPITQFVIDGGDFFSQFWGTIIALLFLVYGLYRLALKQNVSFALWVDTLKLRIPLFGVIVYKNEMGRFSYVSHILIKSGVPFAQTINLSSKILNNLYLRDVFEEASTKVVEGDKLSNALSKIDKNIDPTFIQAIALGEETSQMSEMLGNLSKLYFEENKDRTTLLMALLEPMLMLFVGGMVGFIIIAMLLPIFSLNIG